MDMWDWVLIFLLIAAGVCGVVAAASLTYCIVTERRLREQLEARLEHELEIQRIVVAAMRQTESRTEDEPTPPLAVTTVLNEIG
jgi:hypothetical protein